MNTIMNHEPETKGFNKVRDFQDAVIRACKNGRTDPLDVAEDIYDWFINAPRTVQVAVLQYTVARMWSNVTEKIEAARSTGISHRNPPAPRQPALSTEAREAIKAKVTANLEAQWLDLIIPMTGAQVRAAKMLPDEMLCQVSDDQRVGDVFTADQLRAVAPQT